MRAILLVSHGSRSPKTKEEILVLMERLRQRFPLDIVEFAFLEIEPPNIPDGIDQCVLKGATEIIVTLNFLNAGRHVDDDIPSIISDAKQRYPHINILISKPLGKHASIPDLFVDLINNA